LDLSLPRGISDIEPERFELQAKVRTAFEEVCRLYNFNVMEPASLEHLSTLRVKSGQEIDKEIKNIVMGCYERAEQLLKKNIKRLHALAKTLLERESLTGEEIDQVIKEGAAA
jgi:ATP-dependent Zn protease